MASNIDEIMDLYRLYRDEFPDISPMVPAVLVFSKTVKDFQDNFLNELDNRICLGIRYGLFGKGASDQATITDISQALYELFDALNGVGQAIEKT